MELFPAQPDLSLQISPPNTKPTNWSRNEDECLWKNSTVDLMGKKDPTFDLSHSRFAPTKLDNIHQELSFLRPIRGIPVYQNGSQTFPFANHHHFLDSSNLVSRSRFLSRFPGKRSMRAPRMRWTTTLHARFVHAVDLLGGHERATPKSVLELMDVKDLTLAHVKSHLQMYRTVKSTDRAAATSGHFDAFENGLPGDTSDDLLFDTKSSRKSELPSEQEFVQDNRSQDKGYHGLWSNSSSWEAWRHGKQGDHRGNINSLEKAMEQKCFSYDRISELSSSSASDTSPKKPNLEFTLGRPQ